MLAAINSTARRALLQTAARSGQHALSFVAPRVASAPAVAAVAQTPRRFFSDDSESHSDFQPKYHAAKSTEKDEILKMIESHVKTYPVMLYMKGTPQAPQCGFSMQVVRILHAQGVSFDSVNVLDHPEIREGVKEYSYVDRCCLCGRAGCGGGDGSLTLAVSLVVCCSPPGNGPRSRSCTSRASSSAAATY